MNDGAATRAAAARALDAILHRGRSLKATLSEAQSRLDDPRDRGLLEAIVMAALRQRAGFDAALSRWLNKPLGAGDRDLRALLHVGFAQLALDVPAHAALASTVDAARLLGRNHQAGMVNALLRRAQREGLPTAEAADAWPAWLAARIRADWPADADAIFAASAAPPPMWLRVNHRQAARDAYAGKLAEAGIAHAIDGALPDAIRLDEPMPVQLLPGFDTGVVSVQDGAAQAVADALSSPPGARLLDACAAPGGKAAHLAERDPSLRIVALDVDARRVRRMQEAFARLGLAIDTRAADATQAGAWPQDEAFDAILVDAPCSATGIVRRQPDVLLHRRREDVVALQAVQARLLDTLWPRLARGGALVYATCSILRGENAAQVEAFVARTPDAALEPLDDRFGRDTGFGRQRLPGDGGMDGFFIARLRKR